MYKVKKDCIFFSVIKLFLIISITINLCSCSQPMANEKVLTRSMQDFIKLDPQTDLNMEVSFVAMHIFDRLVEYDKDGIIYPSLIKDMPIISADGLRYTFELKPGVMFTNGDELKSTDVKFTFERMLWYPEKYDKSTWVFNIIKGAKDVEAGKAKELSGFKIISDYKFEIELEKPYAPFIQGLATPYASIFPEKACRESGNKWTTNPIGSGPFIITKWDKGKELVLEKNKNYFGTKPHLDKIISKIYKDNFDFAGVQADYDLGKLDIIEIPTDKYAEYKNDIQYKDSLQTTPCYKIKYITLNNQDPILKNPKVRQAISIAIDRKKFCEAIQKGSSEPMYEFLPSGIGGYDENAYIEFNVAKARQLLKEAGYQNGLKIKYYQANKNNLYMDYAIQVMLEQIGINLEMIQIDENELKHLKESGDLTMLLSTWSADIPDADNFLYNIFHSKMNRTSKYNNPVFDSLCDQARGMTDSNKRNEIYKNLDRMLCKEDWATVPVCRNIGITLVRPGIEGFYVNPITNLPIFKDADIRKGT